MSTIQITEKNFEEHVSKPGILVLDFWAAWCGPCRAFAPVFEAAAKKHDTIVFGKVNTDEEQELAAGFRVQSIPTLMIFRDNVLLFEQPGVLPAAALDEVIEKVRSLDMDEIRKQIAEHEHDDCGCDHDHDDHDHDHGDHDHGDHDHDHGDHDHE
jgi:thioredoxin 1